MLDTKEHRAERHTTSEFDDGVDVADTRSQEDVFADIDALEQLIESLNRVPAIPEHPEVRCLSNSRPIETQPCTVCAAKEARPRYSIEGVAEQLVVCESCGLVTDYIAPARLEREMSRTLDSLSETTGFVPRAHHVQILGLCAVCQRAQGR